MTLRSPWILALFAALSLAPASEAAAQPAKPNAMARPLDEAKRLHAEAVKLKADGKLAEAISTLERVLAIVQKTPGPKSIEAANVTEDLAELTMEVDVRRAAPLYVRCIGILEGKLGKTHLALSRPLHNLSLAYQHMGETDKAIEAAGRALAIREKALGDGNNLTLGSIANLVSIHAKSKQYKKAIALSERIVKALEKALGPEHKVVADQIEDLAGLHYSDGDLAGAVALLDRALAIREKNHGPENPEFLEFIDMLGSLHTKNRGLDRAIELTARALAIRERTRGPDHPEVAGSLTRLANLYDEKGDGKRSLALTERALRIVEKARGPDHIEVADVLNTLAIYVIDQAGYDRAIGLLERAYAIKRKMYGLEHQSVASTLNNLAEAHLRRGDLKRAEPYQEQALAIFEAVLGPEHEAVALALSNLASTQIERGDYASGIPRLKRAFAIYEARLGPRHTDVARAAGNLGEVYLRMGDIGQAEPLLRRAVAIREAAHGPDHPLVGNPLHNLASVLQEKGETAQAEEIYTRVLSIYEKAFGPDHPSVVTTLINLALLRESRGELDQAEATSRRAIAIQERALGKTHPILAIAHKNLAVLYVQKGDSTRAVEEQTSAEEINERHLGLLIATGSEAQKRSFMATLSLATNTTIALHLRGAGSPAAANPPNEAAARLAMTTILRRKGRVLDAMTDSLGALRARLAPGDQALLDDLAAARSKLARELLSPPKAEGSASSSIAKLEDEVERLEAAVSAKSAEFRVATTVVTLEKIQAALPEDTTLVEIVAYRDELLGRSAAEPRYAAYLLRRSGPPEAVDLGPVAHIDAQVSAFRAALSDPGRRDVVSLGRALDELVMRPVRTLLKGARSIAISPDGALNLLPFGALVDEDGRFLVERASFTYLTSGRDLLRQGIRAASRQGATIVANPRFDLKDAPVAESGRRGEEGERARGSADLARLAAAKFTPLPGTAEEASALQSVLPAPKVLTGNAATKAALQALHGPGILHIATHGFFLDDKTASGSSGRGLELEAAPAGPLTSSGRPPDGGAASPRAWQSLESPLIRSGLALAGANGAKADGVLTALEAAGLDLYGTELVVLSACETGVGSATTGDGVYGLRRALVIAGAQTQVMSLWKVDDEATRDLMIAYYGELRGGGGRGASMHKVQLAMLGRKETSHPYFWGAFIVSGDPGRVASLAGPSAVPPPRGPRGCACEAAGAPAPLDEPSASAAGAGLWAFLLTLAAVTSLARRSRGRLVLSALSATLVACSGSEDSGGQPPGGSGGAGSTASSAATASTGSGGAGEGGAGQGGAGQGGAGQGGAGGGESPQGPCDFPHETEVDVATAGELTDALSGAKPGTLIRLAPGTYEGNFKASAAGAPDNPIIVCGPREAVLDGGTTATGYVVHLEKVSGWILSGFTVTRGKKGVMLDESSGNLLTGLLVHDIGEEAVHFRRFSSQNTISLSEIRDTGKETPGFGEGVYIGSAVSNWDSITGSSDVPDTSDDNKVLTTIFGPGITAEHIDVKEGTTGGEVRGNTFYGAGISGANFADSWMDVKGNGYQIEENTGDGSPNDGFQTHVAVSGWGNDNVFSKNNAGVNGPGFGFSVAKSSQGNVVKCDNVVTGAASGFANVDCVP